MAIKEGDITKRREAVHAKDAEFQKWFEAEQAKLNEAKGKQQQEKVADLRALIKEDEDYREELKVDALKKTELINRLMDEDADCHEKLQEYKRKLSKQQGQ